MAWVMNDPLATTNTAEQNSRDTKLWEAEDLGGMTEDNNRLPVPIVWLVLLTVITAFLVTFPLWGQRPTAKLYSEYVKDLDKPEIQALPDAEAMKKIVAMHEGSEQHELLERHPLSMDELRAIKPQIEALINTNAHLEDYTVVGPKVVIANFEGNYRPDGSRERHQPYWDKGYFIDIFYLSAFFLGVVLVVKRLPPYTWQPRHGHEH